MNKLFESYNEALAAAFDLYAKGRGKKAAEGLEESVYDKLTADAVAGWNSTPFDFLEGKTPAMFIDGLVSLPDILELYKEACVVCDAGIPEILKEKLKSFGTGAEDGLIGLACGLPASDRDDILLISMQSVRLLGEWRVVRSAPRLVGLLLECKPEEDMLMDEIEEALVEIGDTDAMLAGMGPRESWAEPQEFLALALAKAGKLNRKESIYKCLKEYFLKYEKTLLGASYLAEYGDGRAIPALRGYAERHLTSLDEMTFIEINSAVESLGGDMKDLAREYGRLRNRRQ